MAANPEKDLRELIAKRRILAIVGSGVTISATKNADAASWPGLLKLGVARCRELDPTLDDPWEQRVLGDIASGRLDDMLSAAEKISRLLQAPEGGEFTRWLRETVGALQLRDPAVLEALRDLHVPLVTTNYDHLIEEVTGLRPATWRDQNKVFRVLRGEEPAILHVHGYWKEPDSVVLGIRAYEKVREDAHEQAVIRALAMNHSLLFVGCGDTLADPNFKPFLSWLRGVNARNEARHYRLALAGEAKALQQQHPPEERIFVLPYGESHADLAGFLRNLAPAAESDDFGPSPRVTPDIAGPAPPPSPKRLPPGLRAFTAADHEWFLRLLPGPCDAGGLPASLWFWKTRLEQGDPDRTYKIGLLCGPSGCGKSSLIKAGLIPALAQKLVLPVYVEATPENTPATFLRELRKALAADESLREALSSLPADQSLSQFLTSLRARPELTGGRKVVLLLDQFEQWLNAHRAGTEDELAGALRLCDGGRLQAVLLVRDEFLGSASLFLDSLDAPIRGRDNSGRDNFAQTGLFAPEHAKKVLVEYGRAYGQLPEPPGALAPMQEQFLVEVVASLAKIKATEGKVVCVHLALLAELLKDRPWTPETLKTLGGVDKVGFHFFKENFDGNTAYTRCRRPAMAVLKALLPEAGSDIRGRSRSVGALLEAAVQADSEVDFTRLMQILNDELRLVTPTELVPSGSPAEDSPAPADAAESRYQLTHDYLVPSLREWLTEKQRETVAGRATLALEQRAGQWQSERKLRFLPDLGEYLRILCFAPRQHWSQDQRAMFRTASAFYAGVLAVGLVLAGVGFGAWNRFQAQDTRNLVQELLMVPPAAVPYAVANLRPMQSRARPLLLAVLAQANAAPQRKLNAALALAALGEVRVPDLLALVAVPDSLCTNLVRALEPAKATALQEIPERIRQARSPEERVRLATVALFLGDHAPLQKLTERNENPTNRAAFIHGYPLWSGDPLQLENLLQEVKPAPEQADLRSAACAALGRIDTNIFTAPEQERLRKTLAKLYTNAPDGGTHGAAAYALTHWGEALPAAPAPTRQPVPDRAWFVNGQGMTMIRIPAGLFRMGHLEAGSDAPPHPVTNSRPFFISDREVTVAEFRQFTNDVARGTNTPPAERLADWEGEDSRFSPTNNCPVQRVNWFDAVKFCNWLSRQEGRTPCYRATSPTNWQCDLQAGGYRLPTEAEWECACGAGSESRFTFGDDEKLLGEYAWWVVNSSLRTWPAGSKLPNLWGLFDLHGNVWEWCQDWYANDYYTQSPKDDPPGPELGQDRVLRGGCWYDSGVGCRSASRIYIDPSRRYSIFGFRVVLASRLVPYQQVRERSEAGWIVPERGTSGG